MNLGEHIIVAAVIFAAAILMGAYIMRGKL
jgi:hypothetical protein